MRGFIVAAGRAALGGLGLLLANAAGAAPLVVSVEGVRDASGDVLVALCDRESFLTAQCPFTARAPARPGQVEVAIDVPPGVWAVQAFHDANANLDLDRSLVGMPKEGVGFSNDAPIRFGPPRFDDAAVEVGEDGGAARLTIRYY